MIKKAQAQVITTVLIILLVLAAIVIVWQVVSNTIESGSQQVEAQTGCIGVNIETTCSDCPLTNTSFVAKRTAQGGAFETSDIIVLVDGEKWDSVAAFTATSKEYMFSGSDPLSDPLETVTITLDAVATSSVEVGVIGDGTTCPGTGIYKF